MAIETPETTEDTGRTLLNEAPKEDKPVSEAESVGSENPESSEGAEEDFTPYTAESLQFPEGFEKDEELTNEFLDYLNTNKRPKEDLERLVQLQTRAMEKFVEQVSTAWQTKQNAWIEEVNNDPEIGGTRLESTKSQISKLIDQYGSAEVRSAFDETYAGNNPHIIRFLHRVAKELNEPSSPAPGSPEVPRTNPLEKLYPTMAGKS